MAFINLYTFVHYSYQWTRAGNILFVKGSVQFSRSVVSDSLQPHGLQHARLPCPSPTPRACSNSCPSSRWCHPTISSSVVPLLLLLSIFLSIRVFSYESVLHIRWPNYWSFSFSICTSNEYSGLISFRIDWSPCSPRDSQESSPTPQFKSNGICLGGNIIGEFFLSFYFYKFHKLSL